MKQKGLTQLATEAGIAQNYINAHGKVQHIELDTLRRLLDAMNLTQPASGPVSTPLPEVLVFIQQEKYELAPNISEEYQWVITLETGELFSGNAENTLTLPESLPLGYHTLTLKKNEKTWSTKLIITPARCYEPEPLTRNEKLWGACIQLYTLRSQTNWGIGDFGDLKQMLSSVAQRNGSFIGLNPLHSLYPAMPESASPYSPSSRNWLNIIYIDVEQLEDFQKSQKAQHWLQQQETQDLLAKVRESELVDYSGVMNLKLTALKFAYQQFSQRIDNDPLSRNFRQFIAEGGEDLYCQGAYDALHEMLYQRDNAFWGWPVWPEEYQHPQNRDVIQFCEQNKEHVEFYIWLQWIADSQLSDCYSTAQQNKMPIGLYRDLAVGVSEGGAETWRARELYCPKASVGAPPDILGPLGQNWGLPPLNPHTLKAQAYQPFIQLLRSNMRHCGALRIDHVMSLLRLWWIPYGETANHGAYVQYPIDDLLAILALESQRHQCMVIGEDLGTVPTEIVGKLRNSGVYSYKVLYFNHSADTPSHVSSAYPTQAMATITTHDLPTLRGFWQLDDLIRGELLGLYPDKDIFKTLIEDREKAKQELLDNLHLLGLVPETIPKSAKKLPMSETLNQAFHCYIASTPCGLLGLQPEDWLNMESPVNIPGTTSEYPNWRRKLNKTLDEMFNISYVNQLLHEVSAYRSSLIFQPKPHKRKRTKRSQAIS